MINELTLGISAIAFVFGVYTYYRDSRRKAKQDTLEAYCELQKETLSKINKWLPSEIKKATENKISEDYKELSGYLAEIERFCVGINEGIYDFDTFYRLSRGYFDSNKGLLKPRLMPLLEVKLSNAKEDYFENLHRVWEKMDKRSGADREP
jgi:hypothetical protein